MLSDASKYRPLKEQAPPSTKQSTDIQSPSTGQITEQEKIIDTQTCAQPEPSKQEEKEDSIEKIKEKEKEDDKENDNDWDIVQHSDVSSPVEQRKNDKTHQKRNSREDQIMSK
ncbi:hypothetical protein RFI_00579 [Reticulomyxa filosa]|uniref:Uncharacterized protein n=1 Tax=Reticulomyxa filosa TaxID=46433 RepID=X6PFN1_RETFI|nr:hypothetical protein RFI_00579 [Reticulomyxa filosa]|eukprot:ETO36487.1 hypothetical protein RFI_00579 [Reticulomyxa filosa]